MKHTPEVIKQAAAEGKTSDSFIGDVLMADICGFTTKFQSMAEKGTRGAEQLSSEVSSTLSRVVSVCAEEGGYPVSFAGDAVTVVFPGAENNVSSAAQRLSSSESDKTLPIRAASGHGNIRWNIIPMDGWSFYSFQGSALSLAAARCAGEDSSANEDLAGLETGDSVVGSPSVSHCFRPPELFRGPVSNQFRHVTNIFISQENRRGNSCPVEFQQLVLDAASEWGGYVSGLETSGDSYRLLVVFGAPVSRENDNSRADNFLSLVFNGASGRVRAGASSGLVFSGSVTTPLLESYTVLGPSVNLAARLHDGAGWNRIYAGPSFNGTSTLQERRVRQMTFKGFADPVTVHQLHPWSRRKSVSASRSPLIERSGVLGRLEASLTVKGSSAILRGETGMGKTRLVEELKQIMAGTDFVHLKCRNIAESSSGDVFSRWFREWLGGGDQSAFREKLYGFIDRLEGLNDPAADHAADELLRAESVLAALLGFYRERSLYSGLDPQGRFSNTVSVIVAFIQGRMLLKRTVLVVDDLQNISSDSTDLLAAVLSHPAMDKPPVLLMAGSLQPDVIEILGLNPVEIELEPLSINGANGFLEWKLGSPPSAELLQWFHRRTEGIPFYMEQYAEMLESPNLVPGDENFPGNLHSLLVARLDNLEPGLRQAVLCASVLGREFSADVLKGVCGAGEYGELLDRGVALCLWIPGEAGVYSFNHNLFREAAYRLQSHCERAALHQSAADVMTGKWADIPERYGQMAYHLEMAEKPEDAAQWYMKAGEYALSRRMNDSCRSYLSKVLTLSSEPDRRIAAHRLIFELLVSSGELEQTAEAIENAMADKAISESGRFVIRLMKANLAVNKGNPEVASDLLADLEEKAPALRGEVLHLKGRILALQGKTEEARDYLLEVYRELCQGSAEDRRIAYRALGNASGAMLRLQNNLKEAEDALKKVLEYAEETGSFMMETICVGNLALVYRYMPGRMDDAGVMTRRHLELARLTGSYLAQLQALGNLGSYLERLSPTPEAYKLYREAIELAEKHGGSDSLSIAHANLAGALNRVRRTEESIHHFRKALEICQNEKLGLYRVDYAFELASVLLHSGDLAGAEDLVEKMQLWDRERRMELQVILLQGKLLAARGKTTQAEELLRSGLPLVDQNLDKFDLYHALTGVTDDRDVLEKCIEAAEQEQRDNPHWEVKLRLTELKAKRR